MGISVTVVPLILIVSLGHRFPGVCEDGLLFIAALKVVCVFHSFCASVQQSSRGHVTCDDVIPQGPCYL